MARPTNGPIDPELVHSRTDFIAFLHALERDFYENNDDWETDEVGAYLNGAARWAEAAARDGTIDPEATWSAFAHILYAAKSYE